MNLGAATWTDLDGRRPIVLLPLGSCEQHGPHLPVDTDAAIATAVATRAAALLDLDVLVAPTLSYGASGEHEDFPGTVSIGHEALGLLLLELARSAARWCGRLVVVNGHGGNLPALVTTVARLRTEGHAAAWWSPVIPGGDAHAGRTETALMLAIRGSSVRREQAIAGAVEPLAELMSRLRTHGVRAVSPTGVLGDPADASAAEGLALWADLAADLAGAVSAWQVGAQGRLR
ncbi:mycofactocin biosynthesis peptidyl-dipeptidase MftE [Actinokineospora sp.]|uniref:mycofactocin biosynthesis peptidyl-dipeptidase MftE n=1 Tax=Actinokineospora sp. TaxID=1872133 RepID=UPI0040378781